MNRGLVSSLCAVALVAMVAAQAQAATQLSLNLRYTDPANPAEGGTWTLVAKTDDADGIAAINAIIDNVDNGIGPDDVALQVGIGAIDPIDAGGANQRPAYLATATGIDLIYGQDIANGPVVSGIGTVSAPAAAKVGTVGNGFADPLHNSAWQQATKIATGTFGATRPSFVNTTDANELVGTTGAIQATSLTMTVRGDSVRTLGLESPANAGLIPGDANRDGVVNVPGDGFILVANIGLGSTWDQGDFNNSGTVDVPGDGFILVANIGLPYTPPAVGAVPEPASIAMAVLAVGGLFGLRRKFA